jgi:RiboL-PSP-HEPN
VIPHTKAFEVLKNEAQKVFDFAIVVSYAVPSLKNALKHVTEDEPIPFRPDHFDSRPIATEKVKQNAKKYKALLSRYIFLSTFSFFEAYFRDVLKEVINFHGDQKILERTSLNRNERLTDDESAKQKRKLQEYPNARNRDRYLSHGRRLAQKGFLFPSALLSSYGLLRLLELNKQDNIRAVDIPRLAKEVFQIQLDKSTEIDVYQAYRETRNKIAHGRASEGSLHLQKAIEANNFLRNLALKIDRHVVEDF